jgi:hypothetical protein
MSPALPLLALLCWIIGMTALIYGRKGLSWLFIGLGFALLVWGVVTSK